MNDRIDCPDCGTEPLPIGSDIWKRWWKAHWTVCEGVVLDAVTLANLRPAEPTMAEHFADHVPDSIEWAGND